MHETTIPIGKFKNTCLRLLDEVHRWGIPLVVTKHGKPLVRIVPEREGASATSLLGTIVHEDADISSTGEIWEAES